VTEEVNAHQTNTDMIQSAPPEVDAGIDMALKVKVSCPSACDLRGKTVRIIAQDGTVVREVALTNFDQEMNETDQFTIKAPLELGTCTWSVVFPAQQVGEVLHEESSMSFSFTVRPHSTSIAVWDVPSPIAFNDRFKIKVGVKCSADCKLTDKEITIYGPRGKKVATGTLGDVPWPGTSALYWAEVELEAPSKGGHHRWGVKFRKPALALPHEGASSTFAFRTARPAEHVVTVEVTDKDTKKPIKNAMVTLHSSGTVYRKRADDGGVARLDVPRGGYKLYAMKGDYKAFEASAEVAGDVTVKVELIFWPDDGVH
jgi:hypothetical protein